MMTEARKRMMAARSALILDEPFWGALALRLVVVEDPDCKPPTAWTDGGRLGYHPDFILSLPWKQLLGLLAHEVLHCVLGHPWRRMGRDNKLWNEACDRAINPELKKAGFKLPDGALYELAPSHAGKSAEWIFARLLAAKNDDSGGDGDGDGAGTPGVEDTLGEVRDATADKDSDDGDENTEEEWRQAAQQAAQIAKGLGRLPGGTQQLVENVTVTRVDWLSVMHRWAQEVSRSDYTWSRPNTRYLAHGLYLPALHSVEMGPIVVAVDTSGSIDSVLRAAFASGVQEVAEQVRPRRVHVVYADMVVQKVDVFERDDVIEIGPQGGGGTSFRPVFEDFLPALDEQPAGLIYLTDLNGVFPQEDPGIPVLWATPKHYEQTAVPFGEVVAVDA